MNLGKLAAWTIFSTFASQLSIWPPSAAVRQVSIADITLSWARLTWPACAARQAGP
jgi:hypothetical protein